MPQRNNCKVENKIIWRLRAKYGLGWREYVISDKRMQAFAEKYLTWIDQDLLNRMRLGQQATFFDKRRINNRTYIVRKLQVPVVYNKNFVDKSPKGLFDE